MDLATNVLLCGLGFIAVALTCTMFATRSMMLGFPSLIFYAVAGGMAYQESTVMWDIYYLIFFACMGMVIFSSLAMYTLRTKKQEIQEGDQFIDEAGGDTTRYLDEGRESPRRTAGKRRESEDELARIDREGETWRPGQMLKNLKKRQGLK